MRESFVISKRGLIRFYRCDETIFSSFNRALCLGISHGIVFNQNNDDLHVSRDTERKK